MSREDHARLHAYEYEHRFSVQAWSRPGITARWKYETTIAECDTAEAVGVALITLTSDGEFDQGDLRKAAVWDRRDDRYVGGNPW